MKVLAVLVLTLAVVLSCGGAAQAGNGHGFPKHCGDHPGGVGAGWYHVRAYQTSCPVARKVAQKFWNHNGQTSNGWRCSTKQIGEESSRANCRRFKNRHQHVRFEYGA